MFSYVTSIRSTTALASFGTGVNDTLPVPLHGSSSPDGRDFATP